MGYDAVPDDGIKNGFNGAVDDDGGLTFETAMNRLETLIARLESGALPLEESISVFEEGSALVKFCQDKLNAYTRRVEEITSKGGENNE